MYDFDEIIPRRGSGCMKWDEAAENELPLWVADMDFRVARPIQEALEKRVAHGIFGYTEVPDSYYASVINWFRRRHGFTMKREWMIYTSGVVPAISAIIKAVTQPGDNVMVLTPVYNCFFSSIRNNGCQAAEVPLTRTADTYAIDFEAMERCAANGKTTAFLLCNPHNPAGRVWTREELQRMGDICRQHGVFVIADEIHCELIMPGHTYTPFAALGEGYRDNCAMCSSPSKAFNIAGLQIANITISNPEVRRRVDRAININEVCDVNPFGVAALQAAYDECEAWLDALNAYLYGNYCHARGYIEQCYPQLKVMRLEGTYLLWVDISGVSGDSEAFCDALRRDAGVWLAAGVHYGKAGEGFIRINLACPRTTLAEALKRLCPPPNGMAHR